MLGIFILPEMFFRCLIATTTLYIMDVNVPLNFPFNILFGLIGLIWIANPLIDKLGTWSRKKRGEND